MIDKKILVNWKTMPHWQRTTFVHLSKATGLFRARLNGETMFIGCAAKGNLGARLRSYRSPNGTGRKHHAGQQIYNNLMNIEMQIAQLDLSPYEMEAVLNYMIRKYNPPWNVPNGRRRIR